MIFDLMVIFLKMAFLKDYVEILRYDEGNNSSFMAHIDRHSSNIDKIDFLSIGGITYHNIDKIEYHDERISKICLSTELSIVLSTIKDAYGKIIKFSIQELSTTNRKKCIDTCYSIKYDDDNIRSITMTRRIKGKPLPTDSYRLDAVYKRNKLKYMEISNQLNKNEDVIFFIAVYKLNNNDHIVFDSDEYDNINMTKGRLYANIITNDGKRNAKLMRQNYSMMEYLVDYIKTFKGVGL